MFGGLLSRIGNTIHNDVVAPIQRGVTSVDRGVFNNPVVNGIINAYQAVNPNSGVNHAAPFVHQAEQTYHTTPVFNNIIAGGHASLQQALADNGNLTGGHTAAAQTNMSNPINQLQLLPGYGTSPAAIIHEALHRQWAVNPNDHQSFLQAYSQGATPQLRSYLASRLAGYKDQTPTELMNLAQASPSIQNEVHSYIPEYYQIHPNVALDGSLADYYSKFFPANFPQIPQQIQPAPIDPLRPLMQGLRF